MGLTTHQIPHQIMEIIIVHLTPTTQVLIQVEIMPITKVEVILAIQLGLVTKITQETLTLLVVIREVHLEATRMALKTVSAEMELMEETMEVIMGTTTTTLKERTIPHLLLPIDLIELHQYYYHERSEPR